MIKLRVVRRVRHVARMGNAEHVVLVENLSTRRYWGDCVTGRLATTLPVWQVQSSNLGPENDYPHRIFVSFLGPCRTHRYINTVFVVTRLRPVLHVSYLGPEVSDRQTDCVTAFHLKLLRSGPQ